MATRFYLGTLAVPGSITPSVDAAWESSAAPFARAGMDKNTACGDTLTTVAAFTSTTGQDRCHRQFISGRMAAGQEFTTSTTFKCRCRRSRADQREHHFAARRPHSLQRWQYSSCHVARGRGLFDRTRMEYRAPQQGLRQWRRIRPAPIPRCWATSLSSRSSTTTVPALSSRPRPLGPCWFDRPRRERNLYMRRPNAHGLKLR